MPDFKSIIENMKNLSDISEKNSFLTHWNFLILMYNLNIICLIMTIIKCKEGIYL